MLESILHTMVKRWYVVTFLAAYLFIASRHWGWRKTIKFLLIGYFIAWASEASSIRNGFPYGHYSYNYDAMPGEIFFKGVPIWDSLSYVFLSFAGWVTALWMQARRQPQVPLDELHRSWKTIAWGALFTMLLDVVIDPVAHRGSEWFLGNIYFYKNPGFYFQVPISNFIGWFLVAFAIMSAFRLTDRMEEIPRDPDNLKLGLALFWGVYLFNLGITVYLKAWNLFIASSVWGIFIFLIIKKKNQVSLLD